MAELQVRSFTVGPVAENAYLIWREGSTRALLVDPGDEPERLMAAIEQNGLELEAILLTHTHFDHIGAVAPIARATGAPVYCPVIETEVLKDPMAYIPWSGIGPYEGHEPERTVEGGEKLDLAGIELDVIFTPGHSPGHVTYSARGDAAMFSGDVLFQGSVGRVDLPGGDWQTLLDSIKGLLDTHPDETTVYPGHMGITTLGRERQTNPYLLEIPR